MSLYDYRISQSLAADDWPFYALIMAAMRRADSANLARLQAAFPEQWRELSLRSNAPAGGRGLSGNGVGARRLERYLT